jgi:hypothetical protein
MRIYNVMLALLVKPVNGLVEKKDVGCQQALEPCVTQLHRRSNAHWAAISATTLTLC